MVHFADQNKKFSRQDKMVTISRGYVYTILALFGCTKTICLKIMIKALKIYV